jgi:hypothetical protein
MRLVLASTIVLAACAAREHPAARAPQPAPPADEPDNGILAHWARGELSGSGECEEDGCFAIAASEATSGYGDIEAYPDTAPPSPVELYTSIPVSNGGAVEGSVRWKTAPRVADSLPGCAGPQRNPSLQVSADGGVAGSLVYLADVGAGKPPSLLGGVLEERACELAPHIQIAAPIGVNLVLATYDAGARPLRIQRVLNGLGEDVSSDPPLWSGSLIRQRQLEVPLVDAGTYEVTCDGGAAGWIIVPRHPYYTLTDANGRFRIDDVPPGEYNAVAWHEPVVLAADPRTGALARSATAEGRVRVRVVAGRLTTQDLLLK